MRTDCSLAVEARMSYAYEAPIPGSPVRQDYLVGNRLLRAIWGFRKGSLEVDFTVYLAEDTHENWPDRYRAMSCP
jgi:hypothetical protein